MHQWGLNVAVYWRTLFYASVNVHYVHVKPSLFDAIGRLSTIEHQ